MNISFNGYGDNVVTFEADKSLVKAGVPVKITESGAVAPCEANDKICGVAVNVRDGFAAVKLSGYTELPVSGECPLGFVKLAASADGGVAVCEDGREVLVVMKDGSVAGFIL